MMINLQNERFDMGLVIILGFGGMYALLYARHLYLKVRRHTLDESFQAAKSKHHDDESI